MKNQTLITPELMDLNTFLKFTNNNRYAGNSAKKQQTTLVCRYAQQQRIKPVGTTPLIIYRWYCKNRKKDKDNIAFAKKFINDGLQWAGILINDNWKSIGGFKDEFYVDKENPRVEIVIEESLEGGEK